MSTQLPHPLPGFVVLVLAMRNPILAQQRLDHRDDFRMNSISRGYFRDYISEHVDEDDRGGHAVRMFGTFHDHMHEMMTDFALYGAQQLGDGPWTPEFEIGFGWRVGRLPEEPGAGRCQAERVERCGEREWRHFVQLVSLMHDRIHP